MPISYYNLFSDKALVNFVDVPKVLVDFLDRNYERLPWRACDSNSVQFAYQALGR